MTRSVTGSRDLWVGLIYLGLGLATLWIVQAYPIGSGAEMGPGYFPMTIGFGLVTFGLCSLVMAFRGPRDQVARFGWRGLLMIPLAVVVFAVTLEPLGLPIALMLLLAITSLAAHGSRLTLPGLAAMAAFTLFCCLVFVAALGLPMPLLGTVFG